MMFVWGVDWCREVCILTLLWWERVQRHTVLMMLRIYVYLYMENAGCVVLLCTISSFVLCDALGVLVIYVRAKLP